MNAQRKLTTALLTRTVRMRMERSSVRARRDLQEMAKHAVVGLTVRCLLKNRQLNEFGEISS